jgi:hypothetical protein
VTQCAVFLDTERRNTFITIPLESRYIGFASYENILWIRHETVCNSTLLSHLRFNISSDILLQDNTNITSGNFFLRDVNESTLTVWICADKSVSRWEGKRSTVIPVINFRIKESPQKGTSHAGSIRRLQNVSEIMFQLYYNLTFWKRNS